MQINAARQCRSLAASWIEIIIYLFQGLADAVEALRLRGLKYNYRNPSLIVGEVEAYAASWIELS